MGKRGTNRALLSTIVTQDPIMVTKTVGITNTISGLHSFLSYKLHAFMFQSMCTNFFRNHFKAPFNEKARNLKPSLNVSGSF